MILKAPFLSKSVETALERLSEASFSAYVVGGAIRNTLLSIPPHDFDVTTSASPSEICEIFCDYTTVKTGMKHGTVTVIIENEPIEITTFRSDGDYLDGRHPSGVSFASDIKEDLSRRDFTMNAIAYNKQSGFVDLFSGISDIENGIIRAVGEPEKRFSEDALRILRALRFASVYDFSIEKSTEAAIRKLYPSLSLLSAERIFSELKLLLCGRGVERILIDYKEVICHILPELKECVGFLQHSPYHSYDVYTHTAKTVSACPSEPKIRLAALLHDCGKPEVFKMTDGVGHFYGHSEVSAEKAETALKRLKSDNLTRSTVVALIKHHVSVINETQKSVKRYMNKLSPDVFSMLIDLKLADNASKTEKAPARFGEAKKLRAIMEEIRKTDACFSLKQLKINGDGIINLGAPHGRIVGEILDILLSEVISGECENSEEALKTRALQIIKNKNLIN